MRNIMPREFYIPKGATKVADKASDAVAFIYANQLGKPCATVFFGKQSKPVLNYRYRDSEEREKAVQGAFASRRARIAAQAEYAAKRNKPHHLEVGHILKSSWGYDQTNVDFYQITKLIGSHTVEIRKIGQTRDGDGWTGTCTPVLDKFIGEPMRKRVAYGNSVKIESYAHAYVWNGTPAHWTAYA